MDNADAQNYTSKARSKLQYTIYQHLHIGSAEYVAQKVAAGCISSCQANPCATSALNYRPDWWATIVSGSSQVVLTHSVSTMLLDPPCFAPMLEGMETPTERQVALSRWNGSGPRATCMKPHCLLHAFEW